MKVEKSFQISVPGKGALGEVKAEPESLQPAQTTAQAIASSNPAAVVRRIPGRAPATAGIAKRSRSAAEDAPGKPSAKRSRTNSVSRAVKAQEEAARQPRQRSSKTVVDVGGFIYIDIKPHAASGPRDRRAQQGQPEAPAVQALGPGLGIPAESLQFRRFGNLAGSYQQRIIIGGENPSKWAKGCAPRLP